MIHVHFLGHQFNVKEYTTQELLEKVQLADSLFDQGKSLTLHLLFNDRPRLQCQRHRKRRSTLPSS